MGFRFKTIGLSLIASAALLACGGGDDAVVAPVTPASTVAAGVSTTLAALGTPAAVTATNATSTAFDVVAAIGDTWRVEFDTTNLVTRVTVLQTAYGLLTTANAYTGNFTKVTSGSYTTYTLTGTGNATATGTLVVDDRTKAASGNLTVGTKASTVAGTGYATPALAKLAGTYNFAYSNRNAVNTGAGLFPEMGAGQFTISADGATVAICPGGIINAAATACTPKMPNSPSVPEAGTLALANGVVTVAGAIIGKLHVHVGDRGPVLIIDQYGANAQQIMRTGAFYAAKATTAAGTEFNGNWACNGTNGVPTATAVVTGTTAQITDQGATVATTETLFYNQAYDRNTSTTLSLPGFLSMGQNLANSMIVLTLSSSLVVAESGNGTDLAVCHRTD
jgi:hypothetical protein